MVRLTYSFMLFCIVSCTGVTCEGKSYGLKEKYFRWMPYKGNETLVFKATNGMVDTIFLTGANKQWGLNDPLGIMPDKYESFVITNRFSDPFLYNVKHRYREGVFLEVEARSKRCAVMHISLNAQNAKFYGGHGLDLDTLDAMNTMVVATPAGTFTDVIVIEPGSREYSFRKNFIAKVYWSRTMGLVRYDMADGVVWNLTKRF